MACLTSATPPRTRRAVAMLVAVDAVCDMSHAALANVEETNADTIGDVENALAGKPREELLAACLSGADPDRVNGWTDYVAAVYGAVDAFRGILPDSTTIVTTDERHDLEIAAVASAENLERYRD